MMNFAERETLCKHPVTKKLFQIMQAKKSNLAVSADLTKADDILKLAEQCGPHICVLKTHIDIVEDFTPKFITELKAIAQEHHFLLFEDRKFADIGNTVKLQYSKGVYNIADWADISNAHVLLGEGIINGLKEVGMPKQRGLLLLAQLSASGNLIDESYQQQAVNMALKHKDFVMGFIAQQRLTDDPELIVMTPGVKFEAGSDSLGQRYRSVEDAINDGSDILIVGRGIYQADDPVAVAKQYQERAWSSL